MVSAGLATRLRSIDAYPKWAKDMEVRTLSGAIVSLVTLTIIGSLVASEVALYLQVQTSEHLVVDLGTEAKMRIEFDFTFPLIPCSLVSVDSTDVSGEVQLDLAASISKQNLDENGAPIGKEVAGRLGFTLSPEELTKSPDDESKRQQKETDCGSCYGAESFVGQCCNTCDEVRNLYRLKGWALEDLQRISQCVQSGETNEAFRQEMEAHHGCRMWGYLHVNKVKGNLIFAPGKSFQNTHNHVHDLAAFEAGAFNLTHRIDKLSFGDSYPGAINPLDHHSNVVTDGGGMFMYFVKVVPTTYSFISGAVLSTNQYSVTEHLRKSSAEEKKQHYGLPGVFVFYELSPIMVKFTETRRSFVTLLTQLCFVVAGVFTVSGIVDRVLYRGIKTIEKKMELGKFN